MFILLTKVVQDVSLEREVELCWWGQVCLVGCQSFMFLWWFWYLSSSFSSSFFFFEMLLLSWSCYGIFWSLLDPCGLPRWRLIVCTIGVSRQFVPLDLCLGVGRLSFMFWTICAHLFFFYWRWALLFGLVRLLVKKGPYSFNSLVRWLFEMWIVPFVLRFLYPPFIWEFGFGLLILMTW